MNTELLTKVEQQFLRKVPQIAVGDQVEVHTIVREKNRNRIQIFKGLVIAIKGSGLRKTFTVRKISAGIGVEKIFPLHSPNISKIKVLRKGDVRRSKLYYLRDRIGKKALKVRTSNALVPEEIEEEPEVAEEELTEAAEVSESEVAVEETGEIESEIVATAEETKEAKNKEEE